MVSSAVTSGRAESWIATSAAFAEMAYNGAARVRFRHCLAPHACCDELDSCQHCCFTKWCGTGHLLVSSRCPAYLEAVIHAVLPLLARLCKAERLAVAYWQLGHRICKHLPAF